MNKDKFQRLRDFAISNDKPDKTIYKYIKEVLDMNSAYAKENQELKKQKEELRSWLKEDKDKIKVYDTKNNNAVELGIVLGLGMCVEKLEELERISNE